MSHPPSLLKTPLYEQHQALGARIVDFGGWALPVNYSSQVEEHHAVRNDVGMFDVSHMTVSDITGTDTLDFLAKVLANDIHKITAIAGKALYSCMLNEAGGVIDDLIVYYLNDRHCRLVTNAATNAKDMAWLQQQAQAFDDVEVIEKPDLALIAIQGPNALQKVQAVFLNSPLAEVVSQLQRFQGAFVRDSAYADGDIFIGRTGYTGEDGIEMIIANTWASSLWLQLQQAGIQPCGLGARDTLRLEAGMSLYGSDLDDQHSPLESGLSWSVAMQGEREFIGKQALELPARYTMIGLVLEAKGVLRGHQAVLHNGEIIGMVTSGSFSPTLGQSIALARVQSGANIELGSLLQVQIRQKQVNARVVNYPFIKK